MKHRNKIGLVFMLGIIALVAGVSAGYTAFTYEPTEEAAQELPEEGELPLGEYEDETLRGEAYGMNEDEPIEVEVVVEGGEITEIVIIDHAETEDMSDPAFEEIPQAVIETQSLDIDTVSGATKTSEGIIKAISEAFKQE